MRAAGPFRDDLELAGSFETVPFAPAEAEAWYVAEPEAAAPPTPFAETTELEEWEKPAWDEEDEDEAEEDYAAPGIPSSPPIPATELTWPGAPPEQLAFMRAVYERHFKNSVASAKEPGGQPFVWDLPDDQLEAIEERLGAPKGKQLQKVRPAAARQARALLAEARAALAAEGRVKTRIGIWSAYRNARYQFGIWQSRDDPSKGFPGYYDLALKPQVKHGVVIGPPVLLPGDYSPAAVKKMARYIGRFIASPGFSNHQNGLALDFGEAGLKLGTFHTGWFFPWLMKNAKRLGFEKLTSEDWHFNYVGTAAADHEAAGPWAFEAGPAAGVPAGKLEVGRVPLLDSHRGGRRSRPDPKRRDPDLILRWNDMRSIPEEIDVVVHLHGFWFPRLTLPRDIEPVSGLDLGQGRSRPTLTVLPRGYDTGVLQQGGRYNVYTFPALVKKVRQPDGSWTDGVTELLRFSLETFAAKFGSATPRVGRLIFTAHSGGGKPLLQILAYHDPHQVHVFDALYWDAEALKNWAMSRIGRDRAALAGAGAASIRNYMSSRGGALRVFHQDAYVRGTRPRSLEILKAISPELGPDLAAWYRVEASKYDHFEIPRTYGPLVLADAAADVPGVGPDGFTRTRPKRAAHHELSFAEDDLEDLSEPPMNELPELSTAAEDEDAAFEADWEAELWGDDHEQGEALGFEASEDLEELGFEDSEDLEELGFEGLGEPEDFGESEDLEEEEDEDELVAATAPTYEVLSAAFEAADLAGRPSWEAESAEDEEAMESAEVESLEAAAFLEDLYSRELAFEQEATASVTYPSGATLQVVSGPTAKGEEHWDPLGTGQPLLDTSEPVRATRLSTDFTVAQLLGGKHFDKARIDPELVRALQKLRDYVGKPLHIASGYRPYAYNVELYTSKYHRTPTMSRHSTGQAADVEIQGMTGMAIAKAAIDTLGTRIGVGIDSNNAHIDVRGKWARWTYFKDKQQNDRAIAEIEAYRRQREHGGPPAQPTPAGAPSASPAPPAQGVAEALGRGLWDVAVRLAIDSGVTDVNQLTNLLFYFRHPEMRGKRIGADQRDLAREWTDIRDRLVTPALHGRQATRQPGAAPARPSRRELELMAEVLPLLERLRGDIPLDFLLGWVAVESGGNINAKGSAKLDERGYFQISREEASSMGLDHDRIRSDKEYSVWAGVQLARRYAKLVQTRFPTVPYGTELFWRIVKFMHAIGMGDAPALLKHMQQDGVEISSWDAVARYAASRGDDLHRRKILRHLPTRFIENVDHLYAAGRRFAAALAR